MDTCPQANIFSILTRAWDVHPIHAQWTSNHIFARLSIKDTIIITIWIRNCVDIRSWGRRAFTLLSASFVFSAGFLGVFMFSGWTWLNSVGTCKTIARRGTGVAISRRGTDVAVHKSGTGVVVNRQGTVVVTIRKGTGVATLWRPALC